MIKTAIVDDNPQYGEEVRKMLQTYGTGDLFECFMYRSKEAFLKDAATELFDLVFLDIVLGEDSGIELGTLLNEKQPEACIIFVSAHPEYFKDVYKASHVYFLTKDFEKERFIDAVDKALKAIGRRSVTLHVGKNEMCQIRLSDVLFVEGYGRHIRVHTTAGLREYPVLFRNLLISLPAQDFVRTHQSFVVHMKYIATYTRQSVTLIDGKSVPVSRSYITSVREKIAFYLGGCI